MMSMFDLGLSKRSFLIASLCVAGIALCPAIGSAAGVKPGQEPPEQINALMIGDRLVNVAYGLGVVPRAMSVRCDFWPFGRTLAKTATRFIGCPHRIVKKNPEIVPETLRELNIKRVLIERSPQFDKLKPFRDPMNVLPILDRAGVAGELGVSVEIIDFGNGVEDAIRQVGALLHRKEKAKDLIDQRRRALAKVEGQLPLGDGRHRIVVLDGVYQSATGKAFVRVELPGGYSDQFLLKPLGLVNVGGELKKAGDKGRHGFLSVRSLEPLVGINPDALVLTGDADAVQRLLAREARRNPALKDVEAIASGAVFALPAYTDSEVVEYPSILRRWATALEKL